MHTELERVTVEIQRVHRSLEMGVFARPPLCAQQMLVSAEDHRASRHQGVDFHAIARAIFVRVIYGRREGASTIVQQVIRVLNNEYEISFRRKLKEISLALLVVERFDKIIFPAIYLSIGYYGAGMVGYQNACKKIGVPCSEENILIAAKIVARLKYPQPKNFCEKRNIKILQREKHLIKLHKRHSLLGLHEYLDPRPIRFGKRSFARFGSSS
ncbi:transglycosylase domain-containing protein [Duganella sp. Dugasp56]|uniref:transglycosylase domain-containing protein n=1 Tax=Duganella sp. Dugasp56 TaxID=3243046 RepID=UPI0039B0737C